MKKIIFGIFVVLLVLAFITTYFLYRVGDKVFDELVDSSILLNDTKFVEKEGAVTSTLTNYNQNLSGKTNAASTPADTTAVNGSNQNTQLSHKLETSEKQESKSVAMTLPSREKLQEIKKNISAADKIFVATSVLQKFSPDEISQMQNMAQNGLDKREKSSIKKLVTSRLNEQDMQRLKNIYNKYK